MAPVRFAGFCVRPSRPPNPNFGGSLGFPWFLLHWALREFLREGAMSVCPPGSCWAPLVSLGAEVLMSFKCCFGVTLPVWLGCTARGSEQSKQGGFECVCVFAQQSAAALSACFRAQGKGDSQRSPAAFSKTLSQLILWLCCLLSNSTAHTACKFIPYLVLVKRLGQPDNATSLKFLLWMTLKEQTSRKPFSVAQGIACPACLISPCFPSLATTAHISTCSFTNAHIPSHSTSLPCIV